MRVPIQLMEIMEEDHTGKMAAIKQQIERGDYRVDPGVVADAIVRRIGLPAQNACSYPDSPLAESTNATPLSPCVTRPIQVRRSPRLGLAFRLRATAGTHTHSS